MALPANYIDARETHGRAIARSWIADAQEGDFDGLGCALIHPDAGHRFLRRMINLWSSGAGDSQMFTLVEFALAGWEDAAIVVRDLINQHTNNGQPLPSFLAYYNAKMLAGHTAPKPRGTQAATDLMTNMLMVTLVMELVALGLQEHRYQLGRKRRASACSIAAEEMTEAGLHRGGEEAVWKVWKRYRPAVVPGWRQAPPKLLAKYQ